MEKINLEKLEVSSFVIPTKDHAHDSPTTPNADIELRNWSEYPCTIPNQDPECTVETVTETEPGGPFPACSLSLYCPPEDDYDSDIWDCHSNGYGSNDNNCYT